MYIMYMIALVVSAISLTLSATTSHNLKHETTREKKYEITLNR